MTGTIVTAGAAASRLERAEAACRLACRPIAFVGVLGMLIVSGVTLVDVAGRWIANAPLAAMNEIISMVFAVAVVACFPANLAADGQLRVDILKRFFAPRLRLWIDAFGAAALLLFIGLLAWRFTLFAGLTMADGRYTPLLELPESPFMYGVAGLLIVATAVQAVVAAHRLARALGAAPPAPEPPSPHETAPSEAALTVVRLSALVVAAVVAGIGLYALVDFPGLSRLALDNTGLTVGAAFVLLWAMLLGLVPLAAVLGLLGVFGTALYIDLSPALSAFATEPAGFITNSLVAVLPLFLMMGSFAAAAGLADDIYRLAHAVLGGLRGGLSLATIGGCAGFGCVTGSSIATAATIGRVSLPEMRARGYDAGLATGCVAAGGTLGQLIPPSGAIVVYALLTEVSIGQLFIAALGPAVVAVALYLLTIALVVRLRPSVVPEATHTDAAELLAALRRSVPVFLLFAAVLGGLYLGVFTASESAAVGAVGAFACAWARGRLRGGAFWRAMEETTQTTAMVYGLIFGALTFAFFVNITAMPDSVTAYVASLDYRPLAIVALLLVMYLVLGCVMDSFAVMVITLPTVAPLVLGLGYDLVWWGIVMVVVVETGLITPPFGINVFVLKAVAGDVPLSTIFRGVLPFVAADFLKLALIVLFPWIVMWLPSTMFN